MSSCADMDCRFKKVHLDCETCKMKLLEVLSSIRGKYSVSIDGEERTANICGEVDPNIVMRALGKSSDHAQLVSANFQHPGRRSQNNYYYSHRGEASSWYDTRQREYYEELPDQEYYYHGNRSYPNTSRLYCYDQQYYNHDSYPQTRYQSSAAAAGGHEYELVYRDNYGYEPRAQYVASVPSHDPVYDPIDNYESISLCSIM